MTNASDELIRLTATEAVAKLKRGEITPLDLIDAAERRIAEVEPAINALPTLCFDRARKHARRLMAGEGRDAEGEPGWLAGLPVAIKDLADVAGVRTTYGSPIFRDHVPKTSHPVVERIERKGGIVIAKSNTPEFGSGGSTFNEVFGRTRNPWNTSLTPGGSTGGGAAALAAGEVWLAHGTDHAGSLRRPATYCSVVGLRPSAGRVTRGTANNLFAPLSVQGPMARTVADVALFLDAMVGLCPRDPLTFEAPHRSFASAVADPAAPRRVAFTADFGGKVPVDRETREICAQAARKFEADRRRGRGGIARPRQHRGGVPGAALTALRRRPRADAADPPPPDQARHRLEHRARPEADAEPDRRRRARACRPVPARGRVLRNLRSPRVAGSLDAGVRREPAHARGHRRPQARDLPGGIPDHGGHDHDGPAFHGGAVRLRPARPAGRPAAGRPPSRRGASCCRPRALFESAAGLSRLLPIDPRPGTVPAA